MKVYQEEFYSRKSYYLGINKVVEYDSKDKVYAFIYKKERIGYVAGAKNPNGTWYISTGGPIIKTEEFDNLSRQSMISHARGWIEFINFTF